MILKWGLQTNDAEHITDDTSGEGETGREKGAGRGWSITTVSPMKNASSEPSARRVCQRIRMMGGPHRLQAAVHWQRSAALIITIMAARPRGRAALTRARRVSTLEFF